MIILRHIYLKIVLATTLEDGSFCNVEIQLVNEGDIINRCLYYWSRIFGSQLEIVKRMLKSGFNIETISKITELPISQIKEIQKSL